MFVDQSVCKGEQLEKGVDKDSEEILEKRDDLAEKSESKLEKGIMNKLCIVCCSLHLVTRFVVSYIQLIKYWIVFLVEICCVMGIMYRLGIG